MSTNCNFFSFSKKLKHIFPTQNIHLQLSLQMDEQEIRFQRMGAFISIRKFSKVRHDTIRSFSTAQEC